MKTEKSLLDDMLSEENLSRAYQQVVRNKGAEGVDGMKYTELKDYLKEHGDEIKEQIRSRKYKPSPVRRVEIPKESGGTRCLGIPTVVDRFIQQAIAQVLTPMSRCLVRTAMAFGQTDVVRWRYKKYWNT